VLGNAVVGGGMPSSGHRRAGHRRGRHSSRPGRIDFTGQELELKLNTQLTREIDRLTTEWHNRCTR